MNVYALSTVYILSCVFGNKQKSGDLFVVPLYCSGDLSVSLYWNSLSEVCVVSHYFQLLICKLNCNNWIM